MALSLALRFRESLASLLRPLARPVYRDAMEVGIVIKEARAFVNETPDGDVRAYLRNERRVLINGLCKSRKHSKAPPSLG
jgi:hypothetical protein